MMCHKLDSYETLQIGVSSHAVGEPTVPQATHNPQPHPFQCLLPSQGDGPKSFIYLATKMEVDGGTPVTAPRQVATGCDSVAS